MSENVGSNEGKEWQLNELQNRPPDQKGHTPLPQERCKCCLCPEAEQGIGCENGRPEGLRSHRKKVETLSCNIVGGNAKNVTE